MTYEWSQTTQNGSTAPATSSYRVRSTVLGGETLTKLDQNGNKSITNVPAEGLLFATQSMVGGASVTWTQRDPLGITETGKGIYDPLGNYIPFQQHDDPRPPAGSYNSSSMSGIAASVSANPFGSDTGCLMDGIPTNCSRVLRAINNGQGDKVTVYGFSLSLELSEFTASYSSVTTTGSRYRLPPTTTYTDDNGNRYVAYGQPAPASEAAVQYVITPGFQLGFEPNPQNPKQPDPGRWTDSEKKQPCDQKLTGDANIDEMTRYVFAEAGGNPTKDHVSNYEGAVGEIYGIVQVFINRYNANQGQFGGHQFTGSGGVLSRASIADDNGGSKQCNRAAPE